MSIKWDFGVTFLFSLKPDSALIFAQRPVLNLHQRPLEVAGATLPIIEFLI
jgi:hypothetical protein